METTGGAWGEDVGWREAVVDGKVGEVEVDGAVVCGVEEGGGS